MLEVEHLAVNYQDVSAVEDVSFSIESGQVVGVIGPNGLSSQLQRHRKVLLKVIKKTVTQCGLYPPTIAGRLGFSCKRMGRSHDVSHSSSQLVWKG
jgi:ABC-type Mn2+/Zn2+ transport system ATPase subunit